MRDAAIIYSLHNKASLADILQYLHSLDPAVIHRDIKPENIIVRDDSGISLIDFYIAHTFKEKGGHAAHLFDFAL